LPSGHPAFAVRSEREQRHGREAVGGVEGVCADVSGRHPDDRDARIAGDPLEAAEVVVDGGGLPARVGEDRGIESGDLTAGGQQQTD